MKIKIKKTTFYKVLRKYPHIERDFFKKLKKEVIKNYNDCVKNNVVLKDLKELRGAHLFISIADKTSIVTVSFTKRCLLKNPFIEDLIIKGRYSED